MEKIESEIWRSESECGTLGEGTRRRNSLIIAWKATRITDLENHKQLGANVQNIFKVNKALQDELTK